MPPRARTRRQADPDRLAVEVLALVNAQAAAHAQTTANVLRQIAAALAGLVDWYDPRQVDAFVAAAADAVRAGRQITAGVTESYLRQQLATLGVDAGRTPVRVADEPRGIPTTEEWARPVKTYRYARLIGLDDLEAEDRAAQRAERIADMDLSLAARDAAHGILSTLDRVAGYRRIWHPELSAGGTCGLCIAAADRLYPRGDLMPLHDRCKCTVAAVVEGEADPGQALNADTLARLYETAGGTSAGALARTRWTVHAHGEIGPVLRPEGEHFRDAADVREDVDTAVDLRPADVPPLTVAGEPAALRALGDDELALLVADPEVAADPDRLDAVLAELDRRDREDTRDRDLAEAATQTDEEFAAAVRAAQAQARGFADEADAAGIDPDEWDPPRRGGTPAQEVRQAWELHVHDLMLQAEDVTRGNLLSPAGKRSGADVYALFTGDAVQSVRYASEELLAWWQEDETRRISWPEWRAQSAGTSSPAARKSRERFGKALQRWEDTRRRDRRRSA